jgi:hypothetical protein
LHQVYTHTEEEEAEASCFIEEKEEEEEEAPYCIKYSHPLYRELLRISYQLFLMKNKTSAIVHLLFKVTI